MGCGKSSIGRQLSELLCCRFMDLDDVIAETSGRSIPEIFASDGETAFRQMELDALEHLLNIQDSCNPKSSSSGAVTAVLALGGGTVMTHECAEMVREKTLCIYLRASADTLIGHLEGESENRPMLKDGKSTLRKRIEELMTLRSSTYEKTAHIIIDTDGKSMDQITEAMIKSILAER